jgi:hypothetical protein
LKLLRDYQGTEIRLTDERLEHILEHPEMASLEPEIVETLARPERVVRSRSDEEARLYYRFYPETAVGGKFLCVVVKFRTDDAFVLTAYLTDKIKRGELFWNATS